jgi:hypothetical protein
MGGKVEMTMGGEPLSFKSDPMVTGGLTVTMPATLPSGEYKI